MPMLDDAVYVYGVSPTSEHDRASLSTVQGVEVKAVEHAGLVAITSRLQGDTLSARDVRAHWRVLEHVFEHATVLPFRFGTVMESEEAVRERLLGPNSERLSGLLEELAGLVQLNLKGRYAEEPLLREIVRGSRAVARLRERVRSPRGATPAEQIRLGQLVEAEIARWRTHDSQIALRELEPHSVGVREEEVRHPNAFDFAFLVQRAREQDFSEAVGRVRHELGDRIEIRYLGPLPPFSFAEADLSAGSETWA